LLGAATRSHRRKRANWVLTPRVSGHVGFSAKLVLENRHFLAKPAVSWSNQLDEPLGAWASRQSAGEPIAKSAKVSKTGA
jgi:hypothetical protein